MVDFESNIGLVYKVYNDRFNEYRWLEEDLIQEGMIGLWKACQVFDKNRGVPFSSYACICIRNAMGMLLRKELRYVANMNFDVQVDDFKPTEQELLDMDEREDVKQSLLIQDI